MATQTVYPKEHEGNGNNLMGQFSSVATVPVWNAFGSQLVLGESCGQLNKPLSMEQPSDAAGRDRVTSTKPAGRTSAERGLEKENATKFNIFYGDCKNSQEGQPQTTISLQSTPPEYHVQLGLGFGQPVVCAKYPCADKPYGVFSTYAPQISGCIMLPLNSTTDGGPIYVNAKQYHGIIRRRQSRAKAAMEKKVTRSRKPYMHYSRHLHALRRPRGSGGRFLNTKNSNDGKAENDMKNGGDVRLSPPTGSQKSKVLQSDSGTMNSPKAANGSSSNISGSEVTSMYFRAELEHFPSNHLGLPFHALSGMVDDERGIVMPSRWVVAADNCYNLKV